VGPNHRKLIELGTSQHNCGNDVTVLWKAHRQMCIISSNTGKIAKRRPSHQLATWYTNFCILLFKVTATAWGLSQEEASPQHYLNWLRQQLPAANVTINCGFVVSLNYPWLAATPDGWVEDLQATPAQGIVEFKNPHSYKDSNIDDAITSKMCTCLHLHDGRRSLKQSHDYYYQVQFAMLCTGMIFISEPVHIECVPFDEEFKV